MHISVYIKGVFISLCMFYKLAAFNLAITEGVNNIVNDMEMQETLSHLNWIAILVAAASTFLSSPLLQEEIKITILTAMVILAQILKRFILKRFKC